jgi:thiosulfate dehydrogenase
MIRRRSRSILSLVALVAAGIVLSACHGDPLDPALGKLPAPLISQETTMVTAWDIPNNPLEDPTLGRSGLADEIRWGFRIFMDTPGEAPHLSGGTMSCGNCHLNAGQRDRALPLVGAAANFPEYNRRAGRDFIIEDRIVGCFLRSQNSTGILESTPALGDAVLPTPETPEVRALAAYLQWLSRGYAPGENPVWRKQNEIPQANRLPLEELDAALGEALFLENCANCHGEDGQGVQIGTKKAGPLWGPNSWNDGAGAARIYTLAGVIRHMMPYMEPGKLTDEEAQHVSAFINSKERPVYPFKELDYRTEPMPVDGVYYAGGPEDGE